MNWEEDGLDHLPEAADGDWVNQKWCESLVDEWDDREEAVEAGHPLRHVRPTHEEWLIEGIGPYG